MDLHVVQVSLAIFLNFHHALNISSIVAICVPFTRISGYCLSAMSHGYIYRAWVKLHCISQSGIMPHPHLASRSLANAMHQHPCASLKVASWPSRAASPVRDRRIQHCCCGVHRQSLVQRESENARSVSCSGFRQTQVRNRCTGGRQERVSP